MTVIAYKNQVLACDSMWSDGAVVGYLPVSGSKIRRTHRGDGLLGVCGNHGWQPIAQRTWERHKDPFAIIGTRDLMKAIDNQDWAALLVYAGKAIYADSQCPPHFVQTPYAIGSGSDIALGAMHHGASAAEAARIAAKLSKTCGGKIVTLEEKQCKQKKPLRKGQSSSRARSSG